MLEVGYDNAEGARQVQDEEARRRQVREVAYNLQRRMKQELAFPAVIHFYCWLLQGEDLPPLPPPPPHLLHDLSSHMSLATWGNKWTAVNHPN